MGTKGQPELKSRGEGLWSLVSISLLGHFLKMNPGKLCHWARLPLPPMENGGAGASSAGGATGQVEQGCSSGWV